MIKTWQQRCEEHPDHQQGIVTQQMIQDRMQEEIDELRQALAQPDDFVYSEDKSYRVSPATGSFGIGDTPSKQETEWIEDGFGTMWQKCGKKDCGKFVVKIGKVDCWNGDCPEAKEKT